MSVEHISSPIDPGNPSLPGVPLTGGMAVEDATRMAVPRRLPIGAEFTAGRGAHHRVWAPKRRKVRVRTLRNEAVVCETELSPEGNGYFSGWVPQMQVGDDYGFLLDAEERLYPDPVSRHQPSGPHGPSRLVDPSAFAWTDQQWQGRSLRGQILYEMHIGTFTPEGTWSAAEAKLEFLSALGVTVIEIMPIAEFAGTFGWGYDGVNLFAPTRLYGSPDDVRHFVDRAHSLGIAVILDVVYNHVGPVGNYLNAFADDYFTDRYRTDWGAAINFDGPDSAPVREFYLANAGYWIEEFHLDGLRLDATQNIYDSSPVPILAEISCRVRDAAAGRATILVGENEPQDVNMLRSTSEGGCGLDGLWNDDFHHSVAVALTGHAEAYYTDYRGSPQELISTAKWNFLYQGQWYRWQGKSRGSVVVDLPSWSFIHFLQNHDQIANSIRGLRRHQMTAPGPYRAMTALLLLMPSTPMLFQGQEFGASSPFLYFADHEEELAELVRKGRKEFLSQFSSIAAPESELVLADPADPRTYHRSKLDWAECEKNEEMLLLHRDLIHLRREDAVLAHDRCVGIDGAVLGAEAFLLRYFSADGADRLLLMNLGPDLPLSPIPEPLMAPPMGSRWKIAWSSEDPRYGGLGTPELKTDENWRLLGHAAQLLTPEPV